MAIFSDEPYHIKALKAKEAAWDELCEYRRRNRTRYNRRDWRIQGINKTPHKKKQIADKIASLEAKWKKRTLEYMHAMYAHKAWESGEIDYIEVLILKLREVLLLWKKE